MMIDRNRYANLAEALADVTDLDKVVTAVAREKAIRAIMAETGETREAVTSVADAAVSMDEEAVLGLMDGEPTTLGRALARYVEELEKDIEAGDAKGPVTIVGELDTLIRYPWPGEKVTGADDELARFSSDVAVLIGRLPFLTRTGYVVEEITALVKDRFFPDR